MFVQISHAGFVSKPFPFGFYKCFPSSHLFGYQVPSSFYLADALVLLDFKLGGGLLVDGLGFTKPGIAGLEGKRLKRCMGALRYLFRNSTLDQQLQHSMHSADSIKLETNLLFLMSRLDTDFGFEVKSALTTMPPSSNPT